jgi:hypothetical protein
VWSGSAKNKPKEKTEKEVQVEIREIMKQITASVTFLPVLEEECKRMSKASIQTDSSVYASIALRLLHSARLHLNSRSPPIARDVERR